LRVAVAEVVEELLDAHRLARRHHAAEQLRAREGVAAGVDVDAEGGELVLLRIRPGVDAPVLVALAAVRAVDVEAAVNRGCAAHGAGRSRPSPMARPVPPGRGAARRAGATAGAEGAAADAEPAGTKRIAVAAHGRELAGVHDGPAAAALGADAADADRVANSS